MNKREERSKELRIRKQQQTMATTSIQHLYQLLGKNIDQVAAESRQLISIDRRYYVHNPAERLRVNLKYSPKSSDNMDAQEGSLTKASILEGFVKRAKKYNSQQKKKTLSLEDTNYKLKNIILGKKEEKRAKFFAVRAQTEDHKPERQNNASMFEKIQNSPQITTKRAVNAEINRQAMKRYETEPEQKQQIANEIDLNSHFQRFKQSLKLKPIEYYIKKSRNNKFSIMGLSVKKHKKLLPHDSIQAKDKSIAIEEQHTEQLQLAIINDTQEQTKQSSNWKIDSIPLIITDKRRKFHSTNPSKMKKKSSFEALITKCLPYLAISEHILWKLEEMIRFYSLVLLSFHCSIIMPEPNDLPKFHRKHVRYSYYVGGGNNRLLITELMEKRWWWKQTNNINEACFIWTQQKLKPAHQKKLLQLEEPATSLLLYAKAEKQRQDKLKKRWQQAKQNQKISNLFSSFECSTSPTQAEQFQVISSPPVLYNHMTGGKFLGNKKSLFLMLKLWFQTYQGKPEELFSFIPETFHVLTRNCSSFESFQSKFNSLQPDKQLNLWIVKPGENSNRGRGIFLSNSLSQIVESFVTRSQQGGTTIIQKYLTNLLLYNGRKFDIRTYLLCITIGGNCKFYWFSEGYLRTSSQLYSLKEFSTMTHLTNDAIQNQGDQYGRYEKGNKLGYNQFQNYLDENYGSSGWKMSDLLKRMKQIAKRIAAAAYPIINAEHTTGFELFGMDFLIDASFKPWLLEVNTNPCLEQSSPLLQKLIPHVVENVLRLAVDPVFPPSVLPNKQSEYTLPQKMVEWNKFQLLFDSSLEKDAGWQSILSSNWQMEKEPSELKIDRQ